MNKQISNLINELIDQVETKIRYQVAMDGIDVPFLDDSVLSAQIHEQNKIIEKLSLKILKGVNDD